MTPTELMTWSNTFAQLSERLKTFAMKAKAAHQSPEILVIEDPDAPYGFGDTLYRIRDTVYELNKDFLNA